MANGLQLQQISGGYFIFSSLYSYMNTRNDALGNLVNGIFDNGGSWNPVLSSFRPMFHESSSLVPRRDPVHDDIIAGISVARNLMKVLVSAVSLTAEAPLKRVRILLQSQQELIKYGRLSRSYRGISDCFVRIIKNEGVFSLWRGNSVSLIRIFPEQVNFNPNMDMILFLFCFRIFMIIYRLTICNKNELLILNFLVHCSNEFNRFSRFLGFVCSSQALKVLYGYVVNRIAVDLKKEKVGYETCFMTLVAHSCFYTCLYPLKYASTRLACDIKCVKNRGERQFNGLLDVYRKTLKSEGFVGIYRGYYIGFVGVIAECVHNLASRGSITKFDPSKKFSKEAALLIGVFGVMVAYPCETVQRRMMMTCGETSKYKNSAEALVHIIKNEGILSLYKGYGACILAMVPVYLVLTGFKKLENRPFGTISVVIETK